MKNIKNMNNVLHNFFKWDIKDFFVAIIGCLIFSLAVNFFIVPNHLYNGGIVGISQLIRSLIEDSFNFKMPFDFAGILAFIINIPLFMMAYKLISKTFYRRTLVCMIFQTIFLTAIPIPKDKIIDDLITSVLIGGIMAGYGAGLTLSASGSGGGTDIIGMVLSMRSKKYTVGKISLGIDFVLYTICGLLYGIPTMLYSIIYVAISSITLDQTYNQNICSYVIVFTKNKPDKIIDFIKRELDRDATYWEANGGYTDTKSYVCYSAMSKYELQHFERNILEIDNTAFMISGNDIGIKGNFEKKLSS